MEMNAPVGPNALDAQGVVGKPLDRIDGRLKVTGGARYAYEMQQDTLYGFVVEASIGKGTIRSIDTSAAEKAPGVALVLTHRNAPEQGGGNHREAHPVLTGPEVNEFQLWPSEKAFSSWGMAASLPFSADRIDTELSCDLLATLV